MKNLDRLYLQHKFGYWQNFAMTSLETLNTKIAVNKLSFPLVTHTALSDEWFDSYGLLKTEHGAELFQIEWMGE
jgi:hypothetical protein